MTLRDLRIFIAVVEAGKMGLAATRLHIAQPTVSHVIAQIEQEYGVKLFERLSKKLHITPEGEQLFNYARHVVSLFDQMEHNLRNSADRILLKVGATITVGACVLTEIINRLERKHPEAEVQVFVDNTRAIEEMVLQSDLDLALVEGDVKNAELVIRPVIQDQLVLACGMQHPFATRTTITADELEGQPFILRENGSGTREKFESYLGLHNIQIFQKWVCHSADAILAAVAGGQGLTVISRMLVQEKVENGQLHLVDVSDMQLNRSFSLIYHKNKFISASIQSLIAEILDYGRVDGQGRRPEFAGGMPMQLTE